MPGTEIPVVLERGASNVQPGSVIVSIREGFDGGYLELIPPNSQILSRPSAKIGSQRLYLTAYKIINPVDKSETSVNGVIRAEDGDAGLIARVISDPRKDDRIRTATENALASGAVSLIPTDNLATTAGQAAAQKALQEKAVIDNALNGTPSFVVEANPQSAVFVVEQTF